MTLTPPRYALAVLGLTIAALQAWDSNALRAEPSIQALIAIGIVIVPGAMMATPKTHLPLIATLAAMPLLALARLLSATHMPELALAAFFPGVLAMINHMRELALTTQTGSSR
jgi:hypothetical protein